ncbi:MAG: cobaltochelatase subunit CobN [Rhizobiaceae bacterium]|nr:cobaltochelatase subunit CobN [Rhizobiaceae bacterium]
MHLLLAQKGSVNETEEAVDLGQSPADLVFISAADTELSSLASAKSMLGQDAPQLRVANMMQLTHPMSVDVYAENTVSKSRIVIARILGGESYFQYGLEKLLEISQQNDVDLIVLPGDDKPDPGLVRFNTVDGEIAERVWDYLKQGGPENMANLLRYVSHLLVGSEEPAEAVPLMKAGIWSPEHGISDLQTLQQTWIEDAPVAAICFYRALVQSGGLQPIEAMVSALSAKGINALPVFISSLKDPVSVEIIRSVFAEAEPGLVLNATGFAVSSPTGDHQHTVLDERGIPVIQIVLAGGSREAWEGSSQGLSARDLAMNVALPEVDGRVFSRAIAFKNARTFDEAVQSNIVVHEADQERVDYVASLAANWLLLQQTNADEKRVGLVLANYPNRDGRLGNGVGLDTPAGTVNVLNAMRVSGYSIDGFPEDGDALIEHLQEGPTNAATDGRVVRETISLNQYKDFFATLPKQIQDEIQARWGEPEADPFYLTGRKAFALSVSTFGNVAVGIQPARGYNIDPTDTYHSPDLVPPHGYIAFYAWLRNEFGAHAIIHMGKHGNLEWLPGKALSLSETCYPEAVMGPVPNFYPFIVNDPGEGTQAKRRISSVIIDHLTPPLTRAESYGPLRDLEALVDEYYEAAGNDPRRLKLLKKQILELIEDIGLDADAGIVAGDRDDDKLEKLDGYLCELKEMQIRDGLHIFGESPDDRLKRDLVTALVRVPRGQGEGGEQSLQRALANDLRLEFDPLDCDMAAEWTGTRPDVLAAISEELWRTHGDTVERIELLASAMIEGSIECAADWTETQAVLSHVNAVVRPVVEACGETEINNLMIGLEGKFVLPGPSGAPTRGRLDVLPTGRNFFSVDSRSVPTPAAWELGKKSAELLIKRYRQDHGEWPTSFGLSAWGTSNMRTGGDDIAQAMALIGAKPKWDHASRRVTGYEVITLAELGRPRVDVTLRISGFFRDAFPAQIELFDKAVRAIGALEEEPKENPIAKRMGDEQAKHLEAGLSFDDATRRAGFRIFGSKPGAYGAGLQALIDEKGWEKRDDLANAYMAWGSYAYGQKEEGQEDKEGFTERLAGVEAVVHNQDNREHDLLDSDDYYQFEGGMTAAVEQASGNRPKVYHNDHSRPERPVVRALEEEIGRVVRARAANPKWIEGVMRHGYKGAFEMAATLDYMFAFSATTGAVGNHHFELLHNAYLVDDDVLEFLREKNPEALKEMADRFLEAIERGLWTPRSNSAKFNLERLAEKNTHG